MNKRFEDLDEVELQSLLSKCGDAIMKIFFDDGMEKPLFALLVFNDPRVGQYICNCQRSDVILALREAANRLERKEDVPR
jgi:hypothetical protein